mmetsp:Transcript_24647/g.51600  ORF Transcript_24647/g.51600 Transcript_24647/m.51600 type:complete len:200 (-) Transcript_24647:1118-1717(-)
MVYSLTSTAVWTSYTTLSCNLPSAERPLKAAAPLRLCNMRASVKSAPSVQTSQAPSSSMRQSMTLQTRLHFWHFLRTNSALLCPEAEPHPSAHLSLVRQARATGAAAFKRTQAHPLATILTAETPLVSHRSSGKHLSLHTKATPLTRNGRLSRDGKRGEVANTTTPLQGSCSRKGSRRRTAHWPLSSCPLQAQMISWIG